MTYQLALDVGLLVMGFDSTGSHGEVAGYFARGGPFEAGQTVHVLSHLRHRPLATSANIIA